MHLRSLSEFELLEGKPILKQLDGSSVNESVNI